MKISSTTNAAPSCASPNWNASWNLVPPLPKLTKYVDVLTFATTFSPGTSCSLCPGQVMEEIRAKSSAAEALIEELMEENEELKREMRQMVEEMDELQDNFRLD